MTQNTKELNYPDLLTKLNEFQKVYLELMGELNPDEAGAYRNNDLTELLKKLDINDNKSVESAILFLKNSMINSEYNGRIKAYFVCTILFGGLSVVALFSLAAFFFPHIILGINAKVAVTNLIIVALVILSLISAALLGTTAISAVSWVCSTRKYSQFSSLFKELNAVEDIKEEASQRNTKQNII